MFKSAVPLALALSLALGLAGCGADDRDSAAGAMTSGEPETVTVTIADFKFGPPALTVTAGSTIVFANTDTQGHTATAKDGSFKTEVIPPAGKAEVTLDAPGEFAYFCALHPFMTATVTVQ